MAEEKSSPAAGRKRRSRFLSFALLTGAALLVIASALLYKPTVTLQVLPKDSVIRLDGKKMAGKKFRALPGAHILTIWQEGYLNDEEYLSLRPWQRFSQTIILQPLGQPRLVTEKNVLSLSFDQKENRYFYLGNEGKTLYMVRQNAADAKTLDERPITPELNKISQAIFSPDFSLAVLKFSSGETGLYDFKQYDLLHQEYHSWGNDIGTIVWRPDGEKLVYYKKTAAADSALFSSDPLRTEETRLFDLRGEGLENPILAWSLDSQKILLTAKNNLYILSYADKVLSKIAEGGVTSALYLPDSQRVLFTQNSQLKLVKTDLVSAFDSPKTEDIGKVKISGGIVNLKAKISADKVNVLPGKNSAVFSQDNAIKLIGLADAEITTLLTLPEKTPILDIAVDETGKNLIYLTKDNKIYQIAIK